MRVCTKCGEPKPLEDFYPKKDGLDGRQRECKACRAIYKAQHYQKNKEQLRQKQKEYAAKNHESIRDYKREWQRSNPEKMRDAYLWCHYRIRSEDYDVLFEQQQGVCKICNQPPEEGKVLAVDHDHKSGEIRGLLCHYCNKGLGHFFDSTLLLEAAQRYLLKSQSMTSRS